MKKILLLIVLVSIIALVIWLWPRKPKVSVSNFDECVQAGYPVTETLPYECRTSDGKVFTEDVGNVLEKQDLIKVDEPRPNAVILSPLTIKGEAKGTWYFEAAFPIKLVDENQEELGRTVATAQEDWMTENFVPFEAELTFTTPTSGRGTLILEKDNPSGLPENVSELRIPVQFEETKMREIELFYYNSKKDPNHSCNPDAVTEVARNIPYTQTPIQDAIKLLLKGELTQEEKADGLTTEFPLAEVYLKGANLKDGILTLEFTDPQNKTSGGSCRVGLLRTQIEKTAEQFPEVKEVRLIPEELFQP